MNILKAIKNFFTLKCDFCKEPETQDDPFLVEICSEAGIQGHKNCLDKNYQPDVEKLKENSK